MTPTAVVGPRAVDWCRNCLEKPNDPCPSCAARRRKVSRLYFEQQRSPADIAREMRIPELKVLRLIEEEVDRHDLERFKRAYSANAPVRELVERWRAVDERNTISELARRAGFDCQAHVKRMLGYKPTSGATKDGKEYPGRILTTIGTDNAERLVRAMGYAPCEIDGL